LAFFIPYFSMRPFVASDGRQLGFKEFGLVGFHCVVALANLQIAAITSYWTWLHHVFYWLSIAICPITVIVVGAARMSPDLSGLSLRLMGTPGFWMVIIATVMVGIIPTILGRLIMSSLNTKRNQVACGESVKPRIASATDDDTAACELD
jgi:hypothetical protein